MPFAFFVSKNALLWVKNVVFTILIFNKLCTKTACFSNKEVVSLRGLLSPHMEEKEMIILDEKYLMSKIYIIRGVQVMLDFDLAAIYGYATKNFNRQVKNNIDRFDEDMRFQLSDTEVENLRCKFCTSSFDSPQEDNLMSKISPRPSSNRVD